MARPRIELEEMRDFAGGWNLKDDPYNLAANESFDLQDVDIDRRGGFGLRRGIQRFIEKSPKRIVTGTAISRTANVVTAVGLFPLNGDPDGLVVGERIVVNAEDNSYDGTFVVATAAGGASTATWSQVAADDPGGGFVNIASEFGTPDSGHTYQDAGGTRHPLISRAGNVKRWTGSAWVNVIDNVVGGAGRAQYEEYRNVLYILPHPGLVPRTWTGAGLATGLTTVVGNYNDDLTAPNNGNFPQCDAIATHKEVMWAGSVVEAGGGNLSRVRWSHPGSAQDWRTNDFIDLDPDDENGQIRALIPFQDRMLVFKDKAIYAIAGDPPAAFSVENLTKKVGTPSRYSVVATEREVYFWDIDTGLWKYDGKSFEYVFEPIFRLIDDAKMNVQFSFQVIVEYHRDRVWCSVPMLAEPYNGRFVSLVYQTDAGKNGAWSIHTATLFGWWIHRASTQGGDTHLIGGRFDGPNASHVYELDVENVFVDDTEYNLNALVLTASSPNSANGQTPDAAAHDLTNDIDVRFTAYRTDWQQTAPTGEVMCSKWSDIANGRSWAFLLNDDGFLEFRWSSDGANTLTIGAATTAIALNDAELEVRATMDVNDGAGNKTVTYYYRVPGATDWINVGSITTAGTTTIFNGVSPITMGGSIEADSDVSAIGFAGYSPFTGQVRDFQLLNGIDGPIIVNAAFWNATRLAPTHTDLTGLVWTWRRGAFIGFVSAINRKIDAWYTTRWFDAGTPAMKKRWKRPVVVKRGGANQTTRVEVLQDYDPTKVAKTFDLITSIPSELVTRAFLEVNATGDAAETATFSNDTTDTLLIGIEIDPVDASSGAVQTLVSKWNGIIGDERTFLFQLNATGNPRIIHTPDGTAGSQIIDTCSAALPDDTRRAVWVEINPNNGAQRVVRFFTSTSLEAPFTQLGATITGATTSLFDSLSNIQIGTWEDVAEPYNGRVYAMRWEQGGEIKTYPNFVAQQPGATAFDDDFFHTWQLIGTATLIDDSVVISDEGVWDVNSWDEMFWARELTVAGERSVILRGSPLGSGVSRALRFRNTTPAQDWRIHGLTMKWIPKRIRN